MDICDKIGTSSGNAKESLKIIIKRLNHPDPHVVVQAITVSGISWPPIKFHKVFFLLISFWMHASTTAARIIISKLLHVNSRRSTRSWLWKVNRLSQTWVEPFNTLANPFIFPSAFRNWKLVWKSGRKVTSRKIRSWTWFHRCTTSWS